MTSTALRPALLLLATLSGCALALSWDPNNLPCDVAKGQECAGGYSCIERNGGFQCVRDRSLAYRDSCQLDRQCPNQAICPTAVKKCSHACALTRAYVEASGCVAGDYCQPSYSLAMFSDGAGHDPVRVAACVDSDGCIPGSVCSIVPGGICTSITSTAAACVTGCQPTFTAAGYQDNCGLGTDGYARFCQPIGLPNNQQLVCLDGGAQPLAEGAPCTNPVATPCAPKLACINNFCRAYCDTANNPGAGCTTPKACCSLRLNPNSTIGWCAAPGTCN